MNPQKYSCDTLIPQGVVASLFVHVDIWDAIKITGHNSVNIAKHETPEVTEKCLVWNDYSVHTR